MVIGDCYWDGWNGVEVRISDTLWKLLGGTVACWTDSIMILFIKLLLNV